MAIGCHHQPLARKCEIDHSLYYLEQPHPRLLLLSRPHPPPVTLGLLPLCPLGGGQSVPRRMETPGPRDKNPLGSSPHFLLKRAARPLMPRPLMPHPLICKACPPSHPRVLTHAPNPPSLLLHNKTAGPSLPCHQRKIRQVDPLQGVWCRHSPLRRTPPLFPCCQGKAPIPIDVRRNV